VAVFCSAPNLRLPEGQGAGLQQTQKAEERIEPRRVITGTELFRNKMSDTTKSVEAKANNRGAK
jgi:hypothetical protein